MGELHRHFSIRGNKCKHCPAEPCVAHDSCFGGGGADVFNDADAMPVISGAGGVFKLTSTFTRCLSDKFRPVFVTLLICIRITLSLGFICSSSKLSRETGSHVARI